MHGHGAAYTGKDVAANPANPEADAASQDSSNAAV
jgi:hypothetical protein